MTYDEILRRAGDLVIDGETYLGLMRSLHEMSQKLWAFVKIESPEHYAEVFRYRKELQANTDEIRQEKDILWSRLEKKYKGLMMDMPKSMEISTEDFRIRNAHRDTSLRSETVELSDCGAGLTLRGVK